MGLSVSRQVTGRAVPFAAFRAHVYVDLLCLRKQISHITAMYRTVAGMYRVLFC